MARARAITLSPQIPAVVGLTATAAFVSAALLLMQSTTYDTWGGVLVGPAVLILSVPALSRQAAREGDRRLFWILVVALIVKLCASLAQLYVNYDFYGGGVDAAGYHKWGIELAKRFRGGNFDIGAPISGTMFLRVVTGVVYTVIGPTLVGGYFVFAWLSFWGLFCFYRAFTIAVPEGRARSYARLLFFLPSLLFWGSSIGKEAWMVFTLGIAALGSAYFLSGRIRRGLVLVAIGLSLASLARPHVAAILGLSLLAAYVLHTWLRSPGRLRLLTRILALVALVVVGATLISNAERFLEESTNVSTGSGVQSILVQVERRTAQGGSEFTPSVVDSPARVPLALVTVLFRPFVVEAHNAQALVSALEGTFLLLISLLRFRWIIAAVGSLRRQSYIVFVLVYVILFVLAFSSIGNFGILVRQRVQLLPIFLVLLAVPPKARKVRSSGPDERLVSHTGSGRNR